MYEAITCRRGGSMRAEAEVLLHAAGAGPHEVGEALTSARRRPDAGAGLGQVCAHPAGEGWLLLLGLGELPPTVAALHQAGAALVKELARLRISVGRIHLPEGVDEVSLLGALAEGMALARWSADGWKQPENRRTEKGLKLALTGADRHASTAIAQGLAEAEATNAARDLAATPPNQATPYAIGEEARRMAKEYGLSCQVYKGQTLAQRQMVGLINVGRASEHKPCMIELTYRPRGKARGTIVLVGKTITFDSGGLSLKIHDSMRTMKYDKAAGCAVLGAMRAIADMKPKHRVVGLLPAAENAISDQAYRVDDIIRYPNGVHVDVTNTDYEGRLVLADGLIHACKRHRPDVLVDLGTLTGEIIAALGIETAGLWSSDGHTEQIMRQASRASGDDLWPMPLTGEHERAIRAEHADIVNLALDRPGKPSQCAAFLKHFLTPGVHWAHLDIAGVAHAPAPRGPYVVGPTGYGVRLLSEFVRAWDEAAS